MSSVLVINGFDFTPYLAINGIEWVRNDVDSKHAGEVKDGTLRRDRVIVRPTMTVNLIDIDYNDSAGHEILQALEPQWVEVTYYDLRLGQEVTRTFYTNEVKHTLRMLYNGERKYRIAPFTLIAKGVPGDGRGQLG